MNRILQILKERSDIRKTLMLVGIIIVMGVTFSVASPWFATAGNISNIASQISEIGLIAIAMSFSIISGNVDLSVGSILGLSAIATGLLMQAGVPIWLAILAALVLGCLLGAINGYLVGYLNMQGIVVSIGTMVGIRGLCFVVTNGIPVSGFPDAFYVLGNGKFLGIPLSFLLMLVLFALAYLVLKRSKIGLYDYAIGNNQEATEYSGINIKRFKFGLMAFNGMMSALAAVFLLSRLGSAEATLGQGYDLDIITAVLIGGISIFGGNGSVLGTFLGLIIIGILRNGLNILGVSVIYQSVILGVLIILTVANFKKEK